MMRASWVTVALALLCLAHLAALAAPSGEVVVVVHVRERIDEGAVLLVKRAVDASLSRNARLLVVVLDTYGGYLSSMDRVVAELSRARCRRVAWVPPGCKAVSAGAVIALSCDDMYVARDAVLGMCKPTPADEKVVNYVKVRVRALAERRGVANATVVALLERMVTENAGFSGRQLVEMGVASLAESLSELLDREGLSKASVVELRRDVLCDVIGFVADPGLSLMMLIVGVLLILLELKAAGFQGWGLLGGVLVALALYSIGVFGASALALTLIVLGVASIVLELKKPGIQAFGIAGVALLSLAVAVTYLREPFVGDVWRYALPSSALIACISAFLLVVMVKAAEAARMRRPTLEDRLVGKVGLAKTDLGPGRAGVVYVDGEDWTAYSDRPVPRGSRVRVVGVSGIVLRVEEAPSDK